MAFHQQARPAPQRIFRPAPEDTQSALQTQSPSRGVEESQTWVLFSPATDAGTTSSYLTESHESIITPGRSRLSDLGSLHTLSRTGTQPQSESLIDPAEADEEDDGELDSLDSHLPEFRSTPDFFSSSGNLHATPVVPTHDGLGSFRLEQEGAGFDMQDRLYAFEQYNPRRIRRRRESFELAQAGLDAEQAAETDKMHYIESWRLEQSRFLLEEVQKETRRRRRSSAASARQSARRAEESAAFDALGDFTDDILDSGDDWHEQNSADQATDRDGVWGRITRKVIRDILGIDDKMLSVLMGEALVEEEGELSTTPKASALLPVGHKGEPKADSTTEPSWQERMLERVARELGLLVHQLSEHPGAFSTFARVQQMHIPYAGLPPIPEGAFTKQEAPTAPTEASVAIPEFQPTVGTQTKPIDVPSGRGNLPGGSQASGEGSGLGFTQEEWEQDLDIRLVFRYLRTKFMSRSTSTGGLSGSSTLATSGAQDVAAKAARVRQHHPLVSRARPADRRTFKVTTPSSPVLFRPASSCASQSTRRSVRRNSGSSRHYWDIGGSVGTSSVIAPTGPMGSWGEV